MAAALPLAFHGDGGRAVCTVPVGVLVTVPPVLGTSGIGLPCASRVKGLASVDPVVDGDALVDASPGRKPNGLLAVDGGLGGTGSHDPLAVCWSMVPLGPGL